MSPLCSYCGQHLIPFPEKPCWHCKKAAKPFLNEDEPHAGIPSFTTRPDTPATIPNYDDLPETPLDTSQTRATLIS